MNRSPIKYSSFAAALLLLITLTAGSANAYSSPADFYEGPGDDIEEEPADETPPEDIPAEELPNLPEESGPMPGEADPIVPAVIPAEEALPETSKKFFRGGKEIMVTTPSEPSSLDETPQDPMQEMGIDMLPTDTEGIEDEELEEDLFDGMDMEDYFPPEDAVEGVPQEGEEADVPEEAEVAEGDDEIIEEMDGTEKQAAPQQSLFGTILSVGKFAIPLVVVVAGAAFYFLLLRKKKVTAGTTDRATEALKAEGIALPGAQEAEQSPEKVEENSPRLAKALGAMKNEEAPTPPEDTSDSSDTATDPSSTSQ